MLPIVLAATLAAGCSSKPAADADAPAAGGGPAAAAQPSGSAPVTQMSMPGGSAQSGQAGVQTVSGPVLETMNAGNYTYVRVKTDTGDVWAASLQFAVAVGDRVTVPLEMPMQNFRSPSLNREFPLIYFASQIAREGEAPAAQPVAMVSSHASPGAAGAPDTPPPAAPVVTKVAPPDGGLSISDVWAKRKALAGKAVTVRGTVVKFNGGIMGRNWFHVQDGSGAAADGTNDLTITSDAVVRVGDVVTVTGTVAVDKDFTAGYAYAVMLENAKLVAK